MPPDAPVPDDLLSIGDLADATGIAPDTIRVWERRYGRPKAIRLPSGHRRYTPDDVRWLRRIAEALSHGHRPSKVVHLSEQDLDELLAPVPESPAERGRLQRQLDLLRAYRLTDLHQDLAKDLDKLGVPAFIQTRLGPLLTAVGRAWSDGEVSVRHEHLLTQMAKDLLRGIRQSLPRARSGPLLVLTTLPGELHDLGIQMVGVAAQLGGVRTHLLGPDTPLEEVVATVNGTEARGVAISVSLATGGIQTDRLLADLRQLLPPEVRLVVGGAGARGVRRGPRGVEYAKDWDALDAWLGDFARARQAPKKAG